MSVASSERSHASTGIAGLDDVLGGGFPTNRVYLVEGNPGAGKTTLALQFLLAGADAGESCVYVTLSETKQELEFAAASHGWSLDKLRVVELIANEDELRTENQLAMFQPSEVELGKTTESVLRVVDEFKPNRLVIDSLSEFRLLAQNSLRYRRQILALKQFFAGRRCTVLFLDDRTGDTRDLQLQSIAHGVVTLEQLAPEFGGERRRLRVGKLRGQAYRGGFHDYIIEKGGLQVFPALIAAEHASHVPTPQVQLASQINELDALLGGGIEYGTSMLVVGPAGCGKSSLSVQYAKAAADRNERALILAFEERQDTLLKRARGMGMDLQPHLESGLIEIQQIDPAQMSPGEVIQIIRDAALRKSAQPLRVVVIDSLNGYLNAMPDERFLVIQLHEVLTFLGHCGVVTFLVVAQHGLIGQMQAPVDATYLADGVILLRYFEAHGEVRQSLSVVKKRTGRHERTIRELRIDREGLQIGAPLREFHGVLTGVPSYDGGTAPLLDGREL